jgi:hypothetical protein
LGTPVCVSIPPALPVSVWVNTVAQSTLVKTECFPLPVSIFLALVSVFAVLFRFSYRQPDFGFPV